MGYPDWPDLLKELEDLAIRVDNGFKPNEGKRKSDPLAYAEDIKSHIHDKTGCLGEYHDWLYELFQPKFPAYDEFHRLLVKLPVRGILTTNYDTVLKEALLKKKRETEEQDGKVILIDETPLVIGADPPRLIHEFLLARSNDPKIPQRIAHLHGMYRNPENIILSYNDYTKNYGLRVGQQADQFQKGDDRWTLHRKFLWSVLATRRVVFIGFSMDDPYLNKMLETVSTDLWGWVKSIHFAIMSISPDSAGDSKAKAERLKNRYGVDTIFYEDSDGSHLRLDHIVAEIAVECGVEIQSTVISQEQLDNNNHSVDEKPDPVAGKSGDKSDWLEQANQRMDNSMARRIDDEN